MTLHRSKQLGSAAIRRHRVWLSAIALVVVCCAEASAVATTWTGGGDGVRWDDAANWNNGVPVGGGGSSSRAFVDLNGTTILIDATTNATSSRLLLADA